MLVSGLSSVLEVVGGGLYNLALMSDGHVYAWGKNETGQLGIADHGSTGYRCTAERVHGPDDVGYLSGITKLAAGLARSLAVKGDGSLWAWSEGGHGQLGIHSENDHTVPYRVHGPSDVGYLTDIIEVEAGDYFSLALRDDGTLWAWGENFNGQLGINSNNDHTVPYQVHGPDNVGVLTGIGPTCSTPPPNTP
jgi:alpha-tubulin suppressor-like RCC1 family protein